MLFLVRRAYFAADRLALPERQILMDRRQVEPVDDRQHFLDHPAHVAVFDLFKLGQEVDQFANEPERPRDEIPGIVQCHRLRIRIQPRQEQPVGQHLREGVGEFLERQFMEDLVAKDLKKPEKPSFLVVPLLPHQLLAEVVAQQLAARGESQCELLRPSDPFGRGRKEALQQFRDRGNALLAQPKSGVFEVCRVAQRLALNAVLVDPDEMQIIGKDDVLR